MKQPSRVLRIKKCISWMFFGKSQRDTFGTRDQLPEVMPQLDEVQDWYRNVPPRKILIILMMPKKKLIINPEFE